MSNHANQTAAHRPFADVYADATARLAATGFPRGEGGTVIAFAAADLYKEVLQVSDASVWVLTDDSPITWVQTNALSTEAVQDIVGAMLTDSSELDFSYNDGAGTATAALVASSVADGKLATSYIKADGTRAFSGDQSMGSHKLTSLSTPISGTDAANKDYVDTASAAAATSDEHIQDVVGAMLTDSADLDFSYNDGAGTETAVLTTSGVAAATYGASNLVPVIAVDSKGRITSASEVAINSTTTNIGNARPERAWGGCGVWVQPDSNNNQSAVAVNSFTVEGATTSVSDADGRWNVYQGNSGALSKGRWVAGNYSLSRRDWKPIFAATIKTYSDLTSSRIWAGLFSATPFGSATPSLHYIAFRYDTGADGTAFWRCVTDNGSGSPTVTTTTAAIAVSTRYALRFECSASDVKFYIDDVLVATHTTTLPTSTQSLGIEVGVNPLSGVRQFWVNHTVLIQPR
jgi:hypothetical protein